MENYNPNDKQESLDLSLYEALIVAQEKVSKIINKMSNLSGFEIENLTPEMNQAMLDAGEAFEKWKEEVDAIQKQYEEAKKDDWGQADRVVFPNTED